MIKEITEENFLLYAASKYDNPQCCDIQEFYDDINRFKYIKRLLGKYKDTGDLKHRLILNHLIILYNVFGKNATDMLFFKLYEYKEELAPFIVMLGYMPEKNIKIGPAGDRIYSSDIQLDDNIVSILRGI